MAQIEIIFPEGRVEGDVTRQHLAQSIQLLKRMLLDQLRQDYLSFRRQAEMLGIRLETLGVTHSAPASGGAPLFIHPHNPSLVWSGRGRRPNWVREFFPQATAPEPAGGGAAPSRTFSSHPDHPAESSDNSPSASAAEEQAAGDDATGVPVTLEALPAETSESEAGCSGENGTENGGDQSSSDGASELTPATAASPAPSPRRPHPARPRQRFSPEETR